MLFKRLLPFQKRFHTYQFHFYLPNATAVILRLLINSCENSHDLLIVPGYARKSSKIRCQSRTGTTGTHVSESKPANLRTSSSTGFTERTEAMLTFHRSCQHCHCIKSNRLALSPPKIHNHSSAYGNNHTLNH